MNNNDTDLLQKIKDNAFYIAFGVGIIAILAVVAVYTMQRDGRRAERGDIDLNKPYDYSNVSNDKIKNDTAGPMANIQDTKSQQDFEKKNIQVAEEGDQNTKASGRKDKTDDKASTGTSSQEMRADDNAAGNSAAGNTTEKNKEVNDTVETSGKVNTDKSSNASDGSDDGEKLPVTSNAGELDFGSGKTLEWPVKGDVILPFSMETTVYFKTLDQYQCNPGMLIACGAGSTVKNAYLGKVEKVTSDNTYGNIVTVYLGNDYRAVYGQLDTIYVKEGDFIKAGESIGTIGKPTDSFEDEGSHLFFQIKKGDTPVDPVSFMQ